jgi:hypothetical protein
MNEEQQLQEAGTEQKGAVAKMLLSRVLSHRVFKDSFLKWLLIAVAFLMPIFFIPGQTVAPEFSKMILLEIVVLLGAFVWSLSRLGEGRVSFPKSLLLAVAGLLAVEFVVSALVSPAPIVSFFGSGYDIGTVNTFIVLFLLMFLSAGVFSDRNRILSLYLAFLLSSVVVLIYQALRRIFGADFLSMGGAFSADVSTPVVNCHAYIVGGIDSISARSRCDAPSD